MARASALVLQVCHREHPTRCGRWKGWGGLAMARAAGRWVVAPSLIAEMGGAGLQAVAGDWNPLAESTAGVVAGAVAGRGGMGPVADVASGAGGQLAGWAVNGRGPFPAFNPCAR